MSGFRCLGCRRHCVRPEYRRVGIGSVCSPECFAIAVRPRRKVPRRSEAVRGPRHKPDVPAPVRARVWERDKGRCRYCGVRAGLHDHHITYRSQGGEHTEGNLILLCPEHHGLVHSDKGYWQPVLRAYIWITYVEGRSVWLAELARQLTHAGLVTTTRRLGQKTGPVPS